MSPPNRWAYNISSMKYVEWVRCTANTKQWSRWALLRCRAFDIKSKALIRLSFEQWWFRWTTDTIWPALLQNCNYISNSILDNKWNYMIWKESTKNLRMMLCISTCRCVSDRYWCCRYESSFPVRYYIFGSIDFTWYSASWRTFSRGDHYLIYTYKEVLKAYQYAAHISA